jgi:hypothetical protein
MAAIAFDTLKAARRLKEVGVPEAQAEAQAELMAEAFVFNMDALVTKDYLEQCLDARFAAQDARIEQRFATQDKRFDKRFAAQDKQFDERFAVQDKRFNQLDLALMEIRGDIKLQRWMLALIIITTVIPTLQDWYTRLVFGG